MFFRQHGAAYPIYEVFEQRVMNQFPETKVKVQKTQISFYHSRLYACVSFQRVKKSAQLPAEYFLLTLGMPYPLESDRVAVKTEPYPGRWTTHFVISAESDLDQELFTWLQQAYIFAENK